MAGKKGTQVQLQTEISNDEEWETFLRRKGLLVVDIYSDWCGPCIAMISYLKKLKLEVGGDNMHLAVAKSDTISALERFRNRSRPTWMFISNGRMVNLIFGTNTPRLVETITEEIQLEIDAQNGNETRLYLEITDLTAEEQEVVDREEAKKKITEQLERDEARRKDYERHVQMCDTISQHTKGFSMVVIWPQVLDLASEHSDIWDQIGLSIANIDKTILPQSTIDEWKNYGDFNVSDLACIALREGKCLLWLLKTSEPELLEQPIEDLITTLLYGPSKLPPGDPETSIGAKFLHKKELPRNLESIVELALAKNTSRAFKKKTISQKVQTGEDHENDENTDQDTDESEVIPGIWTPLDRIAKVVMVHSTFPKVTLPFKPPDPEIVPPHVVMIFEAFKRKEILELADNFKDQLLHFGFFTTANPNDSELIAKTVREFEEIPTSSYSEKLVLAVSKVDPEFLGLLDQIGAVYVSENSIIGEEDSAKFFASDYEVVIVDEPEKNEENEEPNENDGEPEENPERVATNVLLDDNESKTEQENSKE